MTYHLVAFDPATAPRGRSEFLDWERRQPNSTDDPVPALRAWLSDMQQKFPEGWSDDAPCTGYWIGRLVIGANFPWQRMEAAYEAALSLAGRHGVGLFNAGLWTQEVWFPDSGERLVLLHRAALDPLKVPYWAVRLVPYAERWSIGDDGVDALNDTALEDLARCLDHTPDFSEWLASESGSTSQEHYAMSGLFMAVVRAWGELERRRGVLPPPPRRRRWVRLMRWRS